MEIGLANNVIFVVIHPDRSMRNWVNRVLLANGYASEPLENVTEFRSIEPREHIVLTGINQVANLRKFGADMAVWVPEIIFFEIDEIYEAVDILHDGAIDVLVLPLEEGLLLKRVAESIGRYLRLRPYMQRQIKARQSLKKLSKRQREILEFIVRGFTSREIGEELSISNRTVESHRATMMLKLKTKKVSDAIKLFLDAGASHYRE